MSGLPASSKSSASSAAAEIDGDKIPLDRAKRLENRTLIAADRAALKSTIFHFCSGPVPGLAVVLYETVRMLTKHRHLNACYLDDAAFLYRHVHAGFAVDSGSGLKVLVIRNAEQLSFAEVSAKYDELLVKYATNSLAVADVDGSTFTVTALAQEGVFAFAPLLNSRQAITLGVAANIPALGGPASGYMLSCTFDHRLTGGKQVAEFMRELGMHLAGHSEGGRQRAGDPSLRCSRCLRTADELRTLRTLLLPCAEPNLYICNDCICDNRTERGSIPLESDQTIPDWFCEKIWQRKKGNGFRDEPADGTYLVIGANLELLNALHKSLAGVNRGCVVVEIGSEFIKLSKNRYRINHLAPDDYQKLLASLREDGLGVTQILHLGAHGEYEGEVFSLESVKEVQNRGLYSILFLVQALTKMQQARPTQLLVVSSHVQAVWPSDKIAYEKAPLMGLIKTIPLELSWLQCSHLDLSGGLTIENVQHILRELCLVRREPEVAYRDGRRFVPVISKVNMLRQQTQEVPLKQGGTYLLTGGLGSIGVCLAEFLIKEYQAKLVIIGRTALPDRREWPLYFGQQTTVARRIRNYSKIEAAGGEFIYDATDVCDLAGLKSVVASAESKWHQRLSGVIHLAGENGLEQRLKTLDQRLVATEGTKVFELMFQAKVYGTWNLWQLIKDSPDVVFIGFSSICSIFGSAGGSAFSAADSFLDACCHHKRHSSHRRTYCFNWSPWDQSGPNGQYPIPASETARKMGCEVISKRQGWHSLLAGLYRDQSRLIVGFEGGVRMEHGNIGQMSYRTRKMVAYFTGVKEVSLERLKGLVVNDRFQIPSKCEFRQVRELPLTPTGEVDHGKLVLLPTFTESKVRNEAASPKNEVEEQLGAIWEGLLKISQIGNSDNFFALGGHSLLAAQLVARVRTTFGIEFSLANVFESPMLASMAEIIEWGLEQKHAPVIANGERERVIL
jgi:NAD(P)-dependent dehydrogenase (short-subunit alcohol dehydrogenase family)